jgi:hypothetical protein
LLPDHKPARQPTTSEAEEERTDDIATWELKNKKKISLFPWKKI